MLDLGQTPNPALVARVRRRKQPETWSGSEKTEAETGGDASIRPKDTEDGQQPPGSGREVCGIHILPQESVEVRDPTDTLISSSGLPNC